MCGWIGVLAVVCGRIDRRGSRGAVVTDRRGQVPRNLKTTDSRSSSRSASDDRRDRVCAGSAAPRTFVFLLDEFHTPAEDSATMRDALQRFVEARVRPVDLMIVFKPLDSLSSIKLIVSRDVLRQAIETFQGRKGDDMPRNGSSQRPGASAGCRAAGTAQIVTSALRVIATRSTVGAWSGWNRADQRRLWPRPDRPRVARSRRAWCA